MKEDTITNLIADIRKWEKNAKTNSAEPRLAEVSSALVSVLHPITTRLEQLMKDGFYFTPEAMRKFAEEQSKKDAGTSVTPFGRTLKMPIISMPGKATIKYHADDPELPRLAAFIDTVKSDDGKASCDCTIFVGKEVLAPIQHLLRQGRDAGVSRQAFRAGTGTPGAQRRDVAPRKASQTDRQPAEEGGQVR